MPWVWESRTGRLPLPLEQVVCWRRPGFWSCRRNRIWQEEASCEKVWWWAIGKWPFSRPYGKSKVDTVKTHTCISSTWDWREVQESKIILGYDHPEPHKTCLHSPPQKMQGTKSFIPSRRDWYMMKWRGFTQTRWPNTLVQRTRWAESLFMSLSQLFMKLNLTKNGMLIGLMWNLTNYHLF